MTTDREISFHGAIMDRYLRAKREPNYNATDFLQMISDDQLGGYRTGRQLLRSEWADLFTGEARAIVRRRLSDYGFDVDRSVATVGTDGGRS